MWEWLLRRKVRRAERRYNRRVARRLSGNEEEVHRHRSSCHEQGRGHLACDYEEA